MGEAQPKDPTTSNKDWERQGQESRPGAPKTDRGRTQTPDHQHRRLGDAGRALVLGPAWPWASLGPGPAPSLGSAPGPWAFHGFQNGPMGLKGPKKLGWDWAGAPFNCPNEWQEWAAVLVIKWQIHLTGPT